MRGLKAMSWMPPRDWTVQQLLHYHAQSDALIRQVWEPLCLAALNTPAATASATLQRLAAALHGPLRLVAGRRSAPGHDALRQHRAPTGAVGQRHRRQSGTV
ncbi:hypothetical protein G6F35_017875 [Rhizopus arrhizus]|nr:hypothetical protein G6F35_017875 [Rhizopus arrhizus]KAG1253584.1 hypothetical protein G6F66_015099 [Rhizopus arrhizus]